jgi:hypothetical protein
MQMSEMLLIMLLKNLRTEQISGYKEKANKAICLS